MRSVHPVRTGSVLVVLFAMMGCMGQVSNDPETDNAPTTDDAANVGSDTGSRGGQGGDVLQTSLPPGMLDALSRDLKLSTRQVHDLIRNEAVAIRVQEQVREQLADLYAGSWMKEDGTGLVVGVTDDRVADMVREFGAEPRLVARNLTQLNVLKKKLDDAIALADESIHEWYVDVATNAVVVRASDPNSPAVQRFIGAQTEAVRIEPSEERPRPYYDVRGGDEIILGRSALCSMGFAVQGGYVTAGHCGRTNTVTQGSNWVDSGIVRGSIFPGSDMAWVQTNANWNTLAVVNNYSGGTVPVAGSSVAPVGASVCRSGRTTGWRCGVIQAHNTTINYADGPVYGATRTNTCAQGGDSGGSFISGNQAQGVTSGGSGNCQTGGTTFYQPINPILSQFGLTLKTSGGTSGGAKAIVSRLNDKCIDVPNSIFVDGARVQMWNCNGTAAQQWTFVDGTIRAGGLCLDVAGANTADGTPLQIVRCNGHRAQQFVLSAAGDLVSVLANKCVDISGWNQNNGAQLIIWPCHGGANQKWYTR